MSEKYRKSKIYKVCSDMGDLKYYGSTTTELSARYYHHKSQYLAWQADPQKPRLSVFDVFDEYGLESCKIIWVEDVVCENKDQLRAREDYYIRNFECVNTRGAIYPKANQAKAVHAYYEAHKDQIRANMRKRYQHIKDKVSAKGKAVFTCACGAELRVDGKLRHEKSSKHIQALSLTNI